MRTQIMTGKTPKAVRYGIFGTIAFALVLLLGSSRVIAPITHLVGVLNGTISPSSGNLGVLAGEFLIYVAVAGVAYLFLRFGFKLLDSRRAEAER